MAQGMLCALFALALAGCTPNVPPEPSVSASQTPSATPTPPSAHDLAVQRLQAQLDEKAAENARVPITDAMRADAVFELDPTDPTFALNAEDSTFDVEQKVSETKVRLMSDLLFEFGSAKLSATATARIKEYAADLPQNATVSVDGYTDSIGSTSSNLTLSKQRADAVADVLRAARPDLKVTAKGHGEADPVAPNTRDGKDDPFGRAQNRRVEVTYST